MLGFAPAITLEPDFKNLNCRASAIEDKLPIFASHRSYGSALSLEDHCTSRQIVPSNFRQVLQWVPVFLWLRLDDEYGAA